MSLEKPGEFFLGKYPLKISLSFSEWRFSSWYFRFKWKSTSDISSKRKVSTSSSDRRWIHTFSSGFIIDWSRITTPTQTDLWYIDSRCTIIILFYSGPPQVSMMLSVNEQIDFPFDSSSSETRDEVVERPRLQRTESIITEQKKGQKNKMKSFFAKFRFPFVFFQILIPIQIMKKILVNQNHHFNFFVQCHWMSKDQKSHLLKLLHPLLVV